MSRGLFRLYVTGLALIFAMPTFIAAAQAGNDGSLPAPDNPPATVSSSFLDGFVNMSNEALYLLVIAGVLSFICTIVFRQDWNDDVKTGLFAGVCLVAGAIYTYVDQDQWQTNDWMRRFIFMAIAGTLLYKTFRAGARAFTARTDRLSNRGAKDQPI
jgi:hypothetical protein